MTLMSVEKARAVPTAPPRVSAREPARHNSGFAVLIPRDVVKLMMPAFWTGTGLAETVALRYCALVALMVFCYIPLGLARTLLMTDWRPDGLDVVRVRRYGETQLIPLCEDVIAIVERYLAKRKRPPGCRCEPPKRCCCGTLLTSRSGRQLSPFSAPKGFVKTGKAIGAGVKLTAMLLRFCESQLEKTGKPAAARRLMGYRTIRGPRHLALPTVPFEELARTARRAAKWFQPFRREMDNERRATEILLKASAVPASRTALRNPVHKIPVLKAADHPLVGEMTAIAVPEDKKLRGHLKRSLLKNYLAKLDQLVEQGVMGIPQAAELLLTTPLGYWRSRQYHLRNGRAAKLADARRRYAQCGRKVRLQSRPRPDAAQSALVAELRSFPWSKDKETRRGQCRSVVSRYFSDVDAMIRAGRISMKRGRSLLGVTHIQMTMLRAAACAGFPADEVIAAGARRPGISRDWCRRIEAEHVLRPAGESDLVFYFRMRLLGCQGHYVTVQKICRGLHGAVPKLDAAERRLVEHLRDFKWSDEAGEEAAQSEALLAAHLAAAVALVDAGKIKSGAMAKLLRASAHGRFSELRSALHCGLSAAQALRPRQRQPLTPDEWRPALQALEAATSLRPLRPVYFAAVLAGFPGSEDQFRTGTVRRRAELAARLAGA
jgi:hypothetical protein